MRKTGFLALAIVLVLMGLSCSAKVDPTVVYKGTYGSYVKVLKQWTRSKKVYEPSFSTIMVVTATYESEAFRAAYLAEKTRAEALPVDQTALLGQSSREELSSQAVFFVSLYTPKYKWNNLHKPNSSWRLWLVDSKERQVAPLKIEKMSKLQLADTKYYPYTDEWSSYYRVRFPRKTDKGETLKLDEGKVMLLIAGITGRAELVWDVSTIQP